MISVAVGEKGQRGNWWHVLNLIVTTSSTSNLKTFEYAVVDRIVPQTCMTDGIAESCGPQVDVAGNLIGSFQPHPKETSFESLPSVSMFAFDSALGKCGQIIAIGITSRDAVTNEQLVATFGINCDTTACTQMDVSAAYVPDPCLVLGCVFAITFHAPNCQILHA